MPLKMTPSHLINSALIYLSFPNIVFLNEQTCLKHQGTCVFLNTCIARVIEIKKQSTKTYSMDERRCNKIAGGHLRRANVSVGRLVGCATPSFCSREALFVRSFVVRQALFGRSVLFVAQAVFSGEAFCSCDKR